MAIDFSQDAVDWREKFTDIERTGALWNYSLFFWGEDAVADGLSPYIDAAPTEEQKYFLTTQQVDEARHAVFFNRFMKDVVGIGGDRISDGLNDIKPQLTWGFTKVFDRLVDMSDELRRDPSVPKLAAAVTLYHMVIEAALAQPGQHFITSYLTERGVMPGFREGMENVAADEQRHIGFGVKLLSDLRKMDPEVPYAVADLLREVLPWTAAVLVPPNWDMRYIESFGFTIEDIGEEGAASLETKLRSAGMPIDELPGPPVFPVDGTPRERAARGQQMVRAGLLGEKVGPPSSDPQDMAMLFEVIASSLDDREGQGPGGAPVGVHRRRAGVARGRGQRRHPRGPGPRRCADGSPSRPPGRTSWTCRWGGPTCPSCSCAAASAPRATCAGWSARAGCSPASSQPVLRSPPAIPFTVSSETRPSASSSPSPSRSRRSSSICT